MCSRIAIQRSSTEVGGHLPVHYQVHMILVKAIIEALYFIDAAAER